MASYEEKLTSFAQGKRLLRLPRPIRNRADAFCDACGSTLPRTLFALKDIESGRYYFAGVNCLKELASQGIILRRFGKESGQVAYEAEMHLRTEESQGEVILWSDSARENNSAVVSVGDNQPVAASDHENFPPAVLMIQYPDHYSAVVWRSMQQAVNPEDMGTPEKVDGRNDGAELGLEAWSWRG